MKTICEIYIVPETGELYLNGNRPYFNEDVTSPNSNISVEDTRSGLWAILVCTFFRQVSIMLNDAFPGRFPKQSELFEMICDVFRDHFNSPHLDVDHFLDEKPEKAELAFSFVAKNENIMMSVISPVGWPMYVWANVIIMLCRKFPLENENYFQSIFDTESKHKVNNSLKKFAIQKNKDNKIHIDTDEGELIL